MSNFYGATVDEVAEQIGTYIRAMVEQGASLSTVVAIIVRKPGDSYTGAVGSRLGLLAQLMEQDPEKARAVAADLPPRQGYFPIIAMDLVEDNFWIEWVGPFPNSPGGAS